MGNRCYRGPPTAAGPYSDGLCTEDENLLSPPLTVTDNHVIRSIIYIHYKHNININIYIYMSQVFAEIWHFRKCLGNSRKAWVFLNCLAMPCHLQKMFFLDNVPFLHSISKKNFIKTKLGYPNLT